MINKVAILLSGRIVPDIDQYNNFINNLCGEYSCDFFISYPKNTNLEIVNKVIKIYSPKKIIENDEIYFNIDKYNKKPETNKHNTLCMFLSRYKLLNIFKEYIEETSEKYDIVISTRIDLIFYEKLNIDTLLQYINNNKICIPEIQLNYNGFNAPIPWVNDQFAIGNYTTISQYLNGYNSLYNILESGIILHPETLLLNYLHSIKLDIHTFNINYKIKHY